MSDMEQEKKLIQVKSQKFDSDTGIFEGYAAVFGNVDSDGDVIEKGAFAKFLAGDWSRVKVLALHNDEWFPIGKPIELYEDDVGLYIKAKITKTTMGEDIWKLLKDRVLDELSIGYIALDYFMDNDGYRHLTEIELQEVSIVTWAANGEAKILEVKARLKKSVLDPGALLAIADLLEQQAAAIREQAGQLTAKDTRPESGSAAEGKTKSYTLPATLSGLSKQKSAPRK